MVIDELPLALLGSPEVRRGHPGGPSVIGEWHGHCLMDGLPIASKVIGLVIDERVFPLCVLPLLQPL